MARAAIAVKSRTAQDTGAISFPILTYTNALPRNDLRDINATHQPRAEWTAASCDSRPKTADGHRSRLPTTAVDVTATFDFRVTEPPDEVFPTSVRAPDSAEGIPRIGLALGSPSMLESRDNLPPPRFNTEIFVDEQINQPPLPRKPSKWRKIGGLFKAKNALAMPSNELPKVPPKTAVPKLRDEPNNGTTERVGLTEEWPVIEVNSQPLSAGLDSGPNRNRKLSLSGKKGNKPQILKMADQGCLLQVDIPDAQMERYSVMFSQVMNKNQRPSLLARRSRTLDNLRVPNNQDFLAAKLPPVPQRRATSPGRSSFTLFPTSQSSKADHVPSTQNFSRGPSSLLRSNTLPLESPSKISLDQPRATPSVNVASPFESPVVPKIFSSHSSTPRASFDKPLPAIKSELHARAASNLAVAQTVKETQSNKGEGVNTSVVQLRKQPALVRQKETLESARTSSGSEREAKSSMSPMKTRRRSSSLALPRSSAEPRGERKLGNQGDPAQTTPLHLTSLQSVQPIHQERKSSLQAPRAAIRPTVQKLPNPHPKPQNEHQPGQDRVQRPPPKSDARPPRPHLKIQTQQQPRPRPPAKSGSSSSTFPSSTPPTGTLPTPGFSKDNHDRASSPIIRSLSPQVAISPGGTSPRMPFVSEPEETEVDIGMAIESKEPAESMGNIPTIEVSIARSISVSRGKRQVLVPVGAHVDHLHSNERYIERRPLTPRITDVSFGHKHAVSQELKIESL